MKVVHPRVYQPEIDGRLVTENNGYLTRVMRLRPRDSFFITDGKGTEAHARLGEASAFSVEESFNPKREPLIQITLYLPLLKGDRIEWLIEKAVELGVVSFVPFISTRCVIQKSNESRLERWRKIAVAAMLQCGGCILPRIADTVRFDKLCSTDDETIRLFLDEDSECEEPASQMDKASQRGLSILSGPEGGLSDEERNLLKGSGWQPLWLGPRLFRADTAPLVAVSRLLSPSR